MMTSNKPAVMAPSSERASKFGAMVLLLLLQASGVVGQNQTALMTHLFSSYENSVRPVCGQNAPIEVKVGVAVRQIIELDEPKQILYLNAWLRLSWYDCQLHWNASDYAGINKLILPYEKVWAPDITLYDKVTTSAEGTMPGLKDYRVSAASDGTMSYNFPTVISVLCKIDVTYFPFDTQICKLMFGSWAHNGLELDVTNRSAAGDIASFVTNSEFEITRMPLKRNVVIYNCCPEPYPDVTFYIYLKRKPMFYVLNLLFPCILITTVALLGFLLPPDAGEKISLEITVLLSLAVFLLVVSETLPATSETFPYIGMYFACSMLLVSLSTVLTVFVLNVHYKEYRPLPPWMRTLFFSYFARIVCYSNDTPRRAQVQHDYTQQNVNGFVHKSENGHVNCQHEKDDNNLHANGTGRPISALRAETPTPTETQGQLTPLVQVLTEQLRLMRKAEARKDGKQRYESQCNDWRIVGIILDRLFMIVFAFISTIITLALLIPLADQD